MSEAVSCRRGEVSQGVVSLRSSHTLHFGGSAQRWHWGSLLTEQGRTGEKNQENLKVEPHGKVLRAQGVRDKVPRNEQGEQWWTHTFITSLADLPSVFSLSVGHCWAPPQSWCFIFL